MAQRLIWTASICQARVQQHDVRIILVYSPLRFARVRNDTAVIPLDLEIGSEVARQSRVTKRDHDAQDVVQEAFLRAYKAFADFRGDDARCWLLTIVRRTWYTEWRRRANSLELAPLDDDLDETSLFDETSSAFADPQTLTLQGEHTRLVHAALEQLPVEFREVLILRELEEMSYRDIALVADLPIGTVMSRLARGRHKLAALLAPLRSDSRPATNTTTKESPDVLP